MKVRRSVKKLLSLYQKFGCKVCKHIVFDSKQHNYILQGADGTEEISLICMGGWCYYINKINLKGVM